MCKGPEAGRCLCTQRTRKPGGLEQSKQGRAEADKVMETTDQILQGLKYSNSNVNEIAGIQSGW